jgi:integrase
MSSLCTAARSEGANARGRALRQLFAWAIDAGKANTNPAIEVYYIPSRTPDGWHTVTVEEVQQFGARHPVGTMARKGLALFLFTGVRVSNGVRLGKKIERPGDAKAPHGRPSFTKQKGRNKRPKHREIPILPELRQVLDATPSGPLTYWATKFSKPISVKGGSNWMKKRFKESGLPHCSVHGLRKAGTAIAAENGASEYQLMAIFGWQTAKEAARYTKKANKKRMAGDAMYLLVPTQHGNMGVPLSKAVTTSGTIGGKKS